MKVDVIILSSDDGCSLFNMHSATLLLYPHTQAELAVTRAPWLVVRSGRCRYQGSPGH